LIEIQPIRWCGSTLSLLDQRLLPAREEYIECETADDVAAAIREMVVRGAPAIGIAAAYGTVLAANRVTASGEVEWAQEMAPALQVLAASRPTAINLFWAIEQARQVVADGGDVPARLLALAQRLHRDDLETNRRIADFGAALISARTSIYTHCNTGALATGGYGTALGIIRRAHELGRVARVFAGETRPWLQGARLTCWELMRSDIPVSLCVEGAAGLVLQREGIGAVIVGADRITANGDVANKIGTYNLAILARHHRIPFIVAAPASSFDLDLQDGAMIPIEQRAASEVTAVAGQAIAPPGCDAVNPAFDVTPANLITAIVTEHGVIEEPGVESIARHFAQEL
jgi:methylthioribose-1-phosphate isomerase